jgi:hypothetical protein
LSAYQTLVHHAANGSKEPIVTISTVQYFVMKAGKQPFVANGSSLAIRRIAEAAEHYDCPICASV